ncbi:hypothetical protein, partial [Isoptericola sp. NPDC060185]
MTLAPGRAAATADGAGDTTPGVVADADTAADERRDLTVAELTVARARLRGADPAPAERALAGVRARAGGPAPLDVLQDRLGLSAFERSVLLLACGPDLVGDVARELAEHGGGPRLTFATALERLPGAHWDALTHRRPLRRWQLLRLADPDAVLTSPLVPPERVVHHLVGVEGLDEQLELASRPLDVPARLGETFAALVGDVVGRWTEGAPVVMRGPQPRTTRALAAAACAAAGLWPRLLGADAVDPGPAGPATTLQRLVRETVLARVAWVLDVDEAAPRAVAELGRALAGTEAPILLVASTRPGGAALDALGLPVVEVPRLGAGERRAALAGALADAGAAAPD